MDEVNTKRRFVVECGNGLKVGFKAESYIASYEGLYFYNGESARNGHIVGLFNPSAWLFCWELSDGDEWPDIVQRIWGDEE